MSSSSEGGHLFVEPRAGARYLGLGDPRRRPERLDQVVELAGRDAVDIGLHHHRVERSVDAASALEDLGENEPDRNFGILSSTSPALVASGRGRWPLR